MLTGITIFAVSAGALTVAYRVATQAMTEQERVHLRSLARIAASQLDAEGLRELQSNPEQGGELYERLSRPLVDLRADVPDLYYAYTLSPTPAGLSFGLDSSYYVKNQGDGTEVAEVGELYPEAPPAALRALRTGQAEASQTPYTDRWGTFLSGFAPVRDKAGQPVALVGLDLSLQQLEQDLLPLKITLLLALAGSGGLACLAGLDAYRSLRARAVALQEQSEARRMAEEAAGAAAAANQAKSEFIATLSHEIRTPLNGVLGMTDLVLATSLSEQQRECLDTVKNSGRTLLTVLNDILDFSKIEAGKLEIEDEPCVLRPLIEDVLDLYAGAARTRDLELVLRMAPDVPPVIRTDPTRLRQILMNLVGNAVKFTERGEIVLDVDHSGTGERDALRLAVRDTGPGIPAERMDRLFQPFSQADTSTTRIHGGTGLGLVICHRLARALGGDITVASEAGRGSEFTLHLPAREETVPEVAPPPRDGLRGRRLLVALANGANRLMVEEQARSWGMECRCAGSAEELLAQLGRDPVDGVVLDTTLADLPALGGAAALVQRIRGEQAHGAVPVILYRWLGEPIRGGEENLFQALLSKPIKTGTLRRVLERALVAAQPQEAATPERNQISTLAQQCPLRLLVAEDNAVNRRVVELQLRRLGYQVSFALDGEEAVQLQEELQPDLILMDLHMPRLDGLEATRRIRAACGDALHPWIVALTADAAPATCRAALTDGINDFLSKPVGAEALAQALRHAYEVMQGSAEEAAAEASAAEEPAAEA